MTLEEFRQGRELSYENLGRFLKITTSKAYRICTESSALRLVDAHLIVVKTGGEVTIEDLLPRESSDGVDIGTNG